MSEDFDSTAARYVDRELPEAVQQRQLAALGRLTARRPQRLRRRYVLVAALLAGLTGAGLVTAASLGAFDAPVGNRNTAHCYTTSDLGRPDNHNDFGVAVAPNSPTVVGDAAVQAMEYCRSQWAVGRFTTATPTFPDYASGPATHPIPPLVACVLDNGEVAIFPGTTRVCAELGLGTAVL